MASHYVGLELVAGLLLQPPECQDYRLQVCITIPVLCYMFVTSGFYGIKTVGFTL